MLTRFSAVAIGLIIVGSAHADEVVKSIDGREILLRSDGTYEILLQVKENSSGKYKKISIVDLKLDIQDLGGHLVEVTGQLGSFGDFLMLGDPSTGMDTSPVLAEAKKLSREERRYIIEKCNLGCRITVRGEVSTVMFQPGLELHELIR